ncbi:MAG: hypothetical protein ACNA8W_09785 [Bradymonadaceae bacterium]
MKNITIIVLVLFTLGMVTACDSQTPTAPAEEAPAEEVVEEAPPEEAPEVKGQPRPESARVLEERYRGEAKEQINSDNVESVLAELEKEIEAEMAELEE